MKHLLMGVAAIALAATPAMAKNDKGNGGGGGKAEQGQSMKGNSGGGNNAGPAMKVDRGPSMKADKGPSMNQDRGPSMATKADKGPSMKPAKSGRGPAMKADKAPAMKADQGPAVKAANADRGPGMKPAKADDRGDWSKGQDRNDGGAVRVADRRGVRVLDDGRRIYSERNSRDWWGEYEQRGLIDGCPPGLAKKHNGCMPPGLAKARDEDYRYRYATYRPDWWGLAGMGLGSGNYFYDDGYLLRYNGDNVAGYIPLLGGALAIGNPWPSYYAPRPVPQYYVNYYDLGPQGGYRYADNVLYRVDPQTSAITSIAALLTGDDIQIGQPMPMGYDVYNVPYPYRSQYYDSPQSNYRYSDGYVYQMDPTTRLVTAAIELLAS